MNARMPRDMEDTDVMMVVVCCEGRSVRSVLWIEEVVSFEDIGGVLGLGGREDMKVGVGVLTGRRREGSIRQKNPVRTLYLFHSFTPSPSISQYQYQHYKLSITGSLSVQFPDISTLDRETSL